MGDGTRIKRGAEHESAVLRPQYPAFHHKPPGLTDVSVDPRVIFPGGIVGRPWLR